jgi:hypothetical protein
MPGLDLLPEPLITMGEGRPVAFVAISISESRVAVPVDLPCVHFMARPAVTAEDLPVRVQVALRAGKVWVQDGMVHAGDRPGFPAVLDMTGETALVGLVEPQFRAKHGNVAEFMAQDAVVLLNAMPWGMAGFACCRILMEARR